MLRCHIFPALFVFVLVAEATGQQRAVEANRLTPEQQVAFLKEQFSRKVVPQPIRAELKAAIRKHLTEEGPAPLGGELFLSEGGLAMRLITERTSDQKREDARALAGVRKLKAGRASDSQRLIEYGEKMIELIKESYDSPPPHSRFAESIQRMKDSQIKGAAGAIKLLGVAPNLPPKNVATMAGVYEGGVLGTAHPTYRLLPSRQLTLRGDRCGLLLVKFEVFDPSDTELDEFRKSASLPVVILDISRGYGRIRLDDDGLIVLAKGTLKDLFPAE